MTDPRESFNELYLYVQGSFNFRNLPDTNKQKFIAHFMFEKPGNFQLKLIKVIQILIKLKHWCIGLFSLDSRALTNKSLVLVKYFICGKVLKLFYHHDL